MSAHDECRQCGETRGAIRLERLSCAGVSAWDGETEWEAERHRFKPWPTPVPESTADPKGQD